MDVPDPTDYLSKIYAIIATAVTAAMGTLTRAIYVLYRKEETNNANAIRSLESRLAAADSKIESTEKKNEECLKDREELRVEIATAKSRIAALEEKNTEK